MREIKLPEVKVEKNTDEKKADCKVVSLQNYFKNKLRESIIQQILTKTKSF